MASLFDFSRHISDLKRGKKFNEALTFFKEHKGDFSKEQISNNEYLISDIISSLRFTNHFEASYQFLEIYDVTINSKTKERVLTAYGWLLWSNYKAENDNSHEDEDEIYLFDEDEDEEENINHNFHYDKSELIDRIESLIPILLPLKTDYSKTVVSNLFSIVLKTEKKKPAPNWKLVNEFCNSIKPNELCKECSTIEVQRKGQLKKMELASDFENWYAYKTKALMKLGEWQECFEISKKALENIKIFHYSNDIWLSRRIALSKKNLGNTDDTIEEFENILKKKREWFIQKELAELYLEKKDYERAYKLSMDAINNFGPIEFKVDLLFLIGKILIKKGQSDLAFKHISLSKLIRQEAEWRVPQKIFNELGQFSESEIQLSNIKNLKIELKKYWSNLSSKRVHTSKFKTRESKLEGEIVKILHDNDRGKDGFLTCDNDRYYFNLSANSHLTPKVDVGSKVVFNVLPSREGKKEQARILKLL
ncbi:DUF7017 domain-containing protein [Lutimonas vermicola]|uniref:CSD domain-containing protein n=1 Tax=Lutimonas vermicola TaxID=414288 RepID=A0ABU9L4L6_9FLAO